MIDPAQGREAGTRRATVPDALDAALLGASLNGRDRQLLNKLVQWDRRNAADVASLLWRARVAGRAEAGLTATQLEIVVTALDDAATYRDSGADALGCWDCESIPGGRCAEHSKDADRARACTELAAQLKAAATAGADELKHPTDISGFRRQASVAS
jgi:hypothetical protein